MMRMKDSFAYKLECAYDRLKDIAEKTHNTLTKYEKQSAMQAVELLREWLDGKQSVDHSVLPHNVIDDCCGCLYWADDGKIKCNECDSEFEINEKV
jgi:hypothetical protein